MKKEPTLPKVKDFLDYMDNWAPAWLAESWDRVGLFSGAAGQTVSKAWVCLEASPQVLEQAILQNADLILAHHPPFLKPLADLRADRPELAPLLKAAAAGVAVFAAHTNLDAAVGGVNDCLANALGLANTKPLEPAGEDGLLKLVVFVPPDQADRVARVLFEAGAGRVGDYRECGFSLAGQGSFLAPPDGNPFLGRPGEREKVDETRLETVLPAVASSRVIRSLLAVHPYEEPVFDLYPVRQGPAGVGLGRVGDLAQPMPLGDFLAMAAGKLKAKAPLAAGAISGPVSRVAVLGGSGGGYLSAAAAAGAQVLVTGEAGYHAGQQAEALGVCLVTLGHYQTEAVVIEPWAAKLGEMLARRGFTCVVEPYPAPTDPWQRLAEIQEDIP